MNEPRMFPPKILELLKAPGHGDDCELEIEGSALRCKVSGQTFPFIDGIPSLFAKSEAERNEVTGKIRSFYEENPFPSYEGLEEYSELVSKGQQNPFTSRLLRSIGYNKTILECGCGTGQLSQYLQLNNNCALGIDLSLSSLGLAVEHKRRNELERSSFCQMNIFDLALKDDSFDVVISHGVLHHTYDARKAFSHIVKKVKPGGIVMVGLYNYYARVPTWIRARLVGIFGSRIDYVVRSRIRDQRKAEIWVKDQYYNPHETWHSIDEVVRWFEENEIDFVSLSPPLINVEEEAENLFDQVDKGSGPVRILTQLAWLFTIAREGALFDLIGRRRE